MRWITAARRAGFLDPVWYLQRNPDVAASGADPVLHFHRFGRFEGRMPCPLQAGAMEQDLWSGQAEGAEPALMALHRSGPQAERVWAAYALARWAAARGDWSGADRLLQGVDVARDLIGGFGLLAPVLLAIECAVRAQDGGRAQAGGRAATLLGQARATFGPVPALHLMAASLAASGMTQTPQAAVRGWARAMRRIYIRHGLACPVLRPVLRPAGRDALPPFDHLQATSLWPLRHRGGPLVTVILPAFNAAATLPTALQSLCAQSWTTLEILVVDNGSADDTAAIAQDWARRDPRIRLLDGAAEPGAYPARNLGLAAATGDFITVQDADDWSHPHRIRAQLQALLRAPDHPASLSFWARSTAELCFTNWRADVGLIHANVSSLMIRRAVVDRLGYWDRVRVGADTEYCLRIRAAYGPQAILEVLPGVPLAFGRQSSGSLTQQALTSMITLSHGARHEYLQACTAWHARSGADLYLPAHPAQRPFAIPAALTLPLRHGRPA